MGISGGHEPRGRSGRCAAPLAALFAALLSGCAPADPPNIVLITLDTTRADRLGPYGYDRARTPNLDRFARDAVVYDHAYSASSWTLPSHAAIFTGLRPMQHGAQSTGEPPLTEDLRYGMRPLAERFETLAERLRAAGYRTAAVVGGPVLRREMGVAQGFESYDDDFSRPEWLYAGKRAKTVADAAIARLEAFGAGPYFLFVNFFDPHAPYRPPAPLDRGLPPTEDPELGPRLVEHLRAGDPPRPVEDLDPAEREALAGMLAGYDAEIAYMDAHLGRLLDAVARSPRADDTLVAITADHGESFGEHYYFSHGANLYEHDVHVPLIVRPPGGAGGGRREESPIENRRLFAIALEAAGLPVPPEAATGPDDGAVVAEVNRSYNNVRIFGDLFDRDMSAIYVAPYKLIRDSRGREELFDLSRDADESENLAASQPAVRDRLAAELDRIHAESPPLYDPEARAELAPDTEEALRALGYVE